MTTSHTFRRIRRQAAAFVTLAALSGCSAVSDEPQDVSAGGIAIGGNVERTLLIPNNCINPVGARSQAAILGPIIAAAVPALIDFGFDQIQTTLQNAAKDEVFVSRAIANVETKEGKLPARCLSLVRIGSGESDFPFAKMRSRYDEEIGLAGRVSFFAEFQLFGSSDQRAWTAVPTLLYYPEAFGDRGFLDSRRSRTLAIALRLYVPDSPESDRNAATALVQFGEVEVGAQVDFLKIAGIDDEATSIVSWNDVPEKGRLIASPWASVATRPGASVATRPAQANDELRPIIAEAAVTEVKPGSKAAAVLSAGFTASRDALEEQAELLLLKQKRDGARAAALAAREKSVGAYLDALQAAHKAIVAYCAANTTETAAARQERIDTSAQLARALLVLQTAAFAARQTVPFEYDVKPSPAVQEEEVCG